MKLFYEIWQQRHLMYEKGKYPAWLIFTDITQSSKLQLKFRNFLCAVYARVIVKYHQFKKKKRKKRKKTLT